MGGAGYNAWHSYCVHFCSLAVPQTLSMLSFVCAEASPKSEEDNVEVDGKKEVQLIDFECCEGGLSCLRPRAGSCRL